MKDNTKQNGGVYKAVVFDMDGTIIQPLLDFGEIRRQIGISPDEGILESIEMMAPDHAKRASDILLAHELAAAQSAKLMPNAVEIIDKLKNAGLKLALLTRNTKTAMEHVIKRFNLEFDITWAREDGPIKPQPDGILKVCQIFNVTPDQTACIGDFYYDMVAANSAGTTSILLACNEIPHYASAADIVIKDLSELATILL